MAAVEVQAYEDARLTDAASVLARAFATDPVFSWVLLPLLRPCHVGSTD